MGKKTKQYQYMSTRQIQGVGHAFKKSMTAFWKVLIDITKYLLRTFDYELRWNWERERHVRTNW